MFTIEAELRHVGEHALWYVGVGTSVSDTRLAAAARAFDEEIYPEVIRLFARGAEPHGKLTIVNARLGQGFGRLLRQRRRIAGGGVAIQQRACSHLHGVGELWRRPLPRYAGPRAPSTGLTRSSTATK